MAFLALVKLASDMTALMCLLVLSFSQAKREVAPPMLSPQMPILSLSICKRSELSLSQRTAAKTSSDLGSG